MPVNGWGPVIGMTAFSPGSVDKETAWRAFIMASDNDKSDVVGTMAFCGQRKLFLAGTFRHSSIDYSGREEK